MVGEKYDLSFQLLHSLCNNVGVTYLLWISISAFNYLLKSSKINYWCLEVPSNSWSSGIQALTLYFRTKRIIKWPVDFRSHFHMGFYYQLLYQIKKLSFKEVNAFTKITNLINWANTIISLVFQLLMLFPHFFSHSSDIHISVIAFSNAFC